MKPIHIVLLQSDLLTERSLVDFLFDSFQSIHEVHSLAELRTAIARYHVGVAVLDLELASISDVEDLSHAFPSLSIVCNHRVADEELWMKALNAGAIDCCPSYDTLSISRAALDSVAAAHAA